MLQDLNSFNEKRVSKIVISKKGPIEQFLLYRV